MVNNLFTKVSSLSNQLGVKLIVIKEEVFICNEIKYKSNLNPYYEVVGQNITQLLQTLVDGNMDVASLTLRLQGIEPMTLVFDHQEWYSVFFHFK